MNWREKIIRLTGGHVVDIAENPVTCSCGEPVNMGSMIYGSHENPTLAHVEDIKALLQKVPCRECGGSGIVGNKVPSSVDPAAFSPIKDCPTCEGKKHVDLWDTFTDALWRKCLDKYKHPHRDIEAMAIWASRDFTKIMVTAELCGPAAVSFLEEGEKGGKYAR